MSIVVRHGKSRARSRRKLSSGLGPVSIFALDHFADKVSGILCVRNLAVLWEKVVLFRLGPSWKSGRR